MLQLGWPMFACQAPIDLLGITFTGTEGWRLLGTMVKLFLHQALVENMMLCGNTALSY